MILQETIGKIFDAARIEEVVADFVNLKKRGTSLIGLCPFHNEKTPSFHVSVIKGIYKCFGCGKGGNSLDFIMEHEKASYPEALRYLAAKYQINIEESEPDPAFIQQNDDRESLFILNRWAKEFFVNSLQNTPEGNSSGLSYLRERGIRDTAILKFELGYSAEFRYSLTHAALKEGFKPVYLSTSGLSIKPDQGEIYDRFRGRLMFPIHNMTGKIIGFGGRILKKDDKTAKYLNSPESEIYHKSDSLYGIFQAKKSIREKDVCLLAEGYTDVISLSQSGIENVVASSGTSLTQQQIRLISRLTPNITILYDGDKAGIKASLRGIDLILEEGLNVRILLFPHGHDPDSFIQEVGANAFSKYLDENQKDFILFKTQVLLGDAGNDPIRRAGVIHDILESISKVADNIVSALYVRQCSTLLEMDEATLLAELNKLRLKKSKTGSSFTPGNSGNSSYSGSAGYTDVFEPQSSLGHPGTSDDFNNTGSNSQGGTILFQELGEKNSSNGRGLNSSETGIQKSGEDKDETVSFYPDDIQEREILRLLINYGDQLIDDQTVSAFIFDQTEDIEFSNPLYEQFYKELLNQNEKSGGAQALSFSQIRDESMRKLVVDLLSTPYSLSANWDEMHQIKVKKEEELLYIAADTAINHLKMRKVMRMIAENQHKMKGEEQPLIIMELQSIHGMLTRLKSDLSKALGVVVIK